MRRALLLLALVVACDEPAPSRCAAQAERVADACGDELIAWHECWDARGTGECGPQQSRLSRCYAPIDPDADAVAAAGCLVTDADHPACPHAFEACGLH